MEPPPPSHTTTMDEQAQRLLEGILPPAECSDMVLTTRLRTLFESGRKDVMERILQECKFWYHDQMKETSQVYWSENHYIMNCSCELLLREHLGHEIPEALIHRIRIFLNVKMGFGMAEFLSPVYLPFTIASLLNLYDYTKFQILRDLCYAVLNEMGRAVLTASSTDGGIVSPSGRSYTRHRLKTVGLHLNIFIDFLRHDGTLAIGRSPEYPEMALRETLSRTTYRPSSSVFTYFTQDQSLYVEMALSPTYHELIGYLTEDEENVTIDIFASMLWSHGIYIPKQREHIECITTFMDTYGLWHHPHFKALDPVRKFFSCGRDSRACFVRTMHNLSRMYIVRNFVQAAYLTDAHIRIYREGKIIISSLVDYHQGQPAFQQWPFAINMNGIAIWSTFGSVGQGMIPCLGNKEAGKEMSTATITPYIYHNKHRLIVKYKSSNLALRMTQWRLRPSVRWPLEEMDEHGEFRNRKKEVWKWARKGSAIVAHHIYGNTVEFVARDLDIANISILEFLDLFA